MCLFCCYSWSLLNDVNTNNLFIPNSLYLHVCFGWLVEIFQGITTHLYLVATDICSLLLWTDVLNGLMIGWMYLVYLAVPWLSLAACTGRSLGYSSVWRKCWAKGASLYDCNNASKLQIQLLHHYFLLVCKLWNHIVFIMHIYLIQ